MHLRRFVAWQRSRFAIKPNAFLSQPDPRSFGQAARGFQLTAGNFLIAGELVQLPGGSIWELTSRDPDFARRTQAFAWLDELAACDTAGARARAQAWMLEWFERRRSASEQALDPGITGRRLLRMINHAVMLLNGLGAEKSRLYFAMLGRQADYLARVWQHAPAGLTRFEALCALVYCGLALEGKASYLPSALRALEEECDTFIDETGAIPSRNPEELMEIFSLLAWVNHATLQSEMLLPRGILKSLERLAPSLRALRLGDGSLVRFHGGGAGHTDRLNQALADAGVRAPARHLGAMGYTRLALGRSTLVMDTGPVPLGGGSNVHACALSFELSSGLQPILVNMGRPYGFSPKVAASARETGSHSALTIRRQSIFDLERFDAGDMPDIDVSFETDENQGGMAVRARHDGFRSSFGVLHQRQISLINQGRDVVGQDQLAPDDGLTNRQKRNARAGRMPVRVHFRLHPDVSPSLDLGGSAVSLKLPGEETWVFRAEGFELSLLRCTYLEPSRLRPRATKQIVVTARTLNYEADIRWSLKRAG